MAKYAVPYMCIIMNVPSTKEDGKVVTRSLTPIRDLLNAHGYMVTRVDAVWHPHGFTERAIVEFGMSEAHCTSAFKLEKMFEKAGHGLAGWERGARNGPYLWAARDVDANLVTRPCEYLAVPYAMRHEGRLAAEAEEVEVYEAMADCFATFYP